MSEGKSSFLSGTAAIITAIAALLTAVAGLYQAGILRPRSADPVPPTASSMLQQAEERSRTALTSFLSGDPSGLTHDFQTPFYFEKDVVNDSQSLTNRVVLAAQRQGGEKRVVVTGAHAVTAKDAAGELASSLRFVREQANLNDADIIVNVTTSGKSLVFLYHTAGGQLKMFGIM